METIEITDLKDMLNKTSKMYGKKPAYKIRISKIDKNLKSIK